MAGKGRAEKLEKAGMGGSGRPESAGCAGLRPLPGRLKALIKAMKKRPAY